MADLVLGMAKTVVEGTVFRAQSAIVEESQLRKSTRRDLEFIKGEFQMMQCYLRFTTTSKDNLKNSVMSTWVAQLRELAYDVEEGIEFVVHLDPKSDWWLRVIPSMPCVVPERPLDEAAEIMEELKARVHDLRQRILHYNLISDSTPMPASDVKTLPTASQLIDGDMEALTNMITKKTLDLQVISVWVPGGDLEAASTIRRTYDTPRSWRSFPCRAWVKLEQPLNTVEFRRELSQQLETGQMPAAEDDERQTPAAQDDERQTPAAQDGHRQTPTLNKHLIVLEDVSTTDMWDTIRKSYPDNRNGSRIIVITREFKIATYCTGRPYVQRFWADFSLCVFSNSEEVHHLIGRELEIVELRRYVNSRGPQVISVWGMPGTGKSAIVRSVYETFFRRQGEIDVLWDKLGWVDVRHPFDLMAICQSLFIQFKSRSPRENEDTIKECYSILKHQSCLVVIDNLQSKEDWNAIEGILPFKVSESIIIVITNDESIALHSAGFVLNVKALEARAAFELLTRKVAGDKYLDGRDVERNKLIQPLISMCGQLPKVIVAVSDFLDEERSSWFEWKAIVLRANFFFLIGDKA